MPAIPLAEYLRNPLRLTAAEFAADVEGYMNELSKRPIVLTLSSGTDVLCDLEQAAALAMGLVSNMFDAVAQPNWDMEAARAPGAGSGDEPTAGTD